MNKNYLFSFIFLSLFTLGCSNTNQLTNIDKKEDANPTSNDMIELNALTSQKYTLKVGQKAFFKTKVHGSVGLGAEHEIEDTSIIQLVSDDIEFDSKENAEMPGGDAAKKQFIFEALKAGKSKITINENYRGDLKKIASFTIEVE